MHIEEGVKCICEYLIQILFRGDIHILCDTIFVKTFYQTLFEYYILFPLAKIVINFLSVSVLKNTFKNGWSWDNSNHFCDLSAQIYYTPSK